MERSDPYYERILRALVHIQQRLDDEISIDDLARVACFSPFHFHRIFTGMTGESVMAHVRRLRLERAAYQLKYTERPVMDIALDAGYETQESFTRAFKAALGMPPGRYRRRHREVPRVAAPSGVHYEPDAAPEGFTPAAVGDIASRVRVCRRDPMRVVFLRHVGPYGEVGPVWESLMDWCGEHDLLGPDFLAFGLSYDDPAVTEASRLRYDACVSVSDDVEVEPPFALQEVPGGEFAVVLHEEPRTDPCMECYLNDPNITPPEDLLTEIWVPLAPKGRAEIPR
jgi:AraC family transcriptional regulator